MATMGEQGAVSTNGAVPLCDVAGSGALMAKRSVVTAQGVLDLEPIDGVRFREARPVVHDDGVVVEVARTAWPIVDEPIVQVHTTTTLPGRVRGWGIHLQGTDRLFVAYGLVSIVVYDGRRTSNTFGRLNEFRLSERNPGLLVVAPGLYHGWKNIGTDEAIIINMPTRLYRHEAPDALDLPYESDEARAVVPFRW
jgi:dTDP-4-dehydrorhamnose 3,5-epimerase